MVKRAQSTKAAPRPLRFSIDEFMAMPVVGPDSNLKDIQQRCKRLLSLGFTGGFRPSYNTLKYCCFVSSLYKLEHSENGHKDFVFLCNRIANILRREYENDDNHRLCRLCPKTGRPTPEYVHKQQNGCCGSFDTILTNEATKSSFMFGFNYGH